MAPGVGAWYSLQRGKLERFCDMLAFSDSARWRSVIGQVAGTMPAGLQGPITALETEAEKAA